MIPTPTVSFYQVTVRGEPFYVPSPTVAEEILTTMLDVLTNKGNDDDAEYVEVQIPGLIALIQYLADGGKLD